MKVRIMGLTAGALIMASTPLVALPGDIDTAFNPNVNNGTVYAAATQTDGKVVIVGDFTTVGALTRNRVARLNSDGTVDSSFNPNVNALVICVAIQPDGKIVIGGQFSNVGGQTRGGIARLNADGSVEGTGTFNTGTGASGEVDCVLIQPDGKIILAGFVTSVNSQPRNYIARLNADGTVEGTGTFNIGVGANNSIYGAALQADGKIVISGFFTAFNGSARSGIARLNSDGTLEGTGTFNPTLNSPAHAIAVQPDGKMWLGGDFTTVNGASVSRLVRLNSNGTTATAITGSPATVRCMALQTDGKLLVGGDFTALNGQARGRIARLNADGTLESTSTFATGAGADNIVRGITLLPDGKIIVSGSYTNFAGSTVRPRITRLLNDTASQSLTIPTVSLAQWTRTGAGPEIISASFELSTNGGSSWSPLGDGTRVANGWDMSGLSLSGAGLIRARGRITAGNQTGSSSFVETVQSFNTTGPEIGVEQPVNTNLTDGSSTASFGAGMTGSTSAAKVFTIKNLGFVNMTGVSVTKDGTASADYTIDTTGMSSTVAAGASTTFSVTFTPSAIGTSTAALHIASDDGDENPFDIALTGDGVVASQIAQQAYAKASNTGTGDVFGAAVAISGDTVVVGAFLEDSSTTGINSTPNESAADAGAVYVFVRSGSTWTQQAYLKASNTGGGDQFGGVVAIAGDTLVVGALFEDSNTTGINSTPNESATDAGAAYVFTRSGSTWTQQAYLKASNTGGGDRFGNNVSISGDSIVVGALFEDSGATGIGGNQNDNSVTDCGAAYVFTRSGVTWTQQAYLKGSSATTSDQFGISVGISGDTIVVGDHGDDSNATGINGNAADNSSADSGAAFVFVRSGITWTQQAYLKPSNTRAGDLFGFSSAIDGNTIVIGSIREDSAATGIGGSQSDNTANDAGAAYVYTRNGSIWTQQAYLKPSNTGAGDNFGRSVSISGDTLLVGSNLEDCAASGVYGNESDNNAADAGAGYVFVRAGNTWVQQAYLKASNTDAGDNFGYFVGLSGGTAVVGSVNEDSNATGIGGNQTDNSLSSPGAAYIFTGLGPADITVEQPVGTTLTDGVSSISFGSVSVTATSAAKTFTITNAGVGPMLGIAVLKDGTHAADFSVNTTGMSTSLAAGASTTFSVTFAPMASGARTAALHIACNDVDEGPFDIALTGTGVAAPEIVVEQPVGTSLDDGAGNTDFGNVALVASSTPKSFTITNTGNIALAVTGINKSGSHPGDFAVGSFTPGSLAPAASMTFTVTFTPSNTGARSAIVSIANDDADEGSFDINVIGNGVASLSPEIVVEQPVGVPVTRSVRGWGYNDQGQTITPPGLTDVAAIDAGNEFSVALKNDGTVVAWGWNQLNQTNVPVGLSNVKAIAAGHYHTVCLKHDGTVAVFGSNDLGQLAMPGGLTGIVAIGAGAYHSVALRSDGTVVAWGFNNHGQISVPPGLTDVIAVDCGYNHNLALKADGTVVGWGSNIETQLDIPGGLTGVQSLAAGYYFNFVLKTDGTAVGWGSNNRGQLNIPVGLTGLTALSSGGEYGSALKSDGTIVEWGYNPFGQTNIPVGLVGVQAIAAGGFHMEVMTQSVPFAAQVTGTASAAKSFVIRNTGNAPLNVSSVNLIGGNASDFTLNTSGMVSSVSAGSSTTFTVTFNPIAVGSLWTNLRILTDDSDESVTNIALTGISATIGSTTNANLANLVPGAGALSPAFSPSTTSYTASVDNAITSITVTPTVAEVGATVTVNGNAVISGSTSAPVSLNVGSNTITIIVTATNGVTIKSHTLTVTRQLPGNANLFDLTMSVGGFGPFFVADITSYFALVSNPTTSITVTPTAAAGDSTITVNNQPVISGSASQAISLSLGTNPITIVVTAVDGAVRTYTLTVTRAVPPGAPGPGSLDSSVTANVTGTIRATTVQPDGKVIVCGIFSSIAGQSRNNIARLNADGTLESTATFNTGTGPNADILSATVQNDGKILVVGYFTTWNGQSRNRLTRLNADGTLDSSFNIGTGFNPTPYGAWVQPDGKILVWGPFTSFNGQTRNRLVRLNSNGSLESTATFNIGTGANQEIIGVAVQPDGKILVGGLFTQFNGQPRTHIARLNSDGSVESLATFNPGAGVNGASPYGTRLFSILPQPDGKILLSGEFINVDGQPRRCIARIHANGSLESTATFDVGSGVEGGEMRSMVLQADGKIILGGTFKLVAGQLRNNIARLNTDGSVEGTATFDLGAGPVGAPYGVLSTALQADGKLLIGGTFNDVNGTARQSLARLLNGAATQTLTVTSQARVEWLRGGTAPEVTQVTFEMSTDAGANWTPLGLGARISGGWEISGLGLPAHGYTVRARGRVSSCDLNGSCGLVESTTFVPTLVTDFRQIYFGTTSNTGIAADTADPDHDGLENIVEYAFGLNPVQPGASSQLPQPAHNGDNFGFSFVQPPNVTGIVYGAKCSVNMVDWFPVPDTGSGGTHEFRVPFDVNRRMFLFLVVTPQP